MTTFLAKDDDNNTVPVLGFKLGGAQHLSVTSGSPVPSNAISGGTKIVTIYTDEPVFFEYSTFANVVSNSTSHYLAGNMYLDISIRQQSNKNNVYFSFIAVSENAEVHLSERT